MSATRDLIAAALTAAELMEGMIGESYRPVGQMLRELCARAMVQPDMTEVERLLGEYAFRVECYRQDVDRARTALLDYVRGVIAERDQFRDAAKMVTDERQLFESWIVRECGPGETKRWLNTEAYENMRVNDYRTGWVACLGLMSAAPQPVSAAEVPMPEPDCVTFSRTPEGFGVRVDAMRMDSAIRYGDAREAAGYARAVAAVRDYAVMRWKAEVDLRPLENKHRRTMDDVWRQVISHTGGDPVALIGPCHDALVALRGEVK